MAAPTNNGSGGVGSKGDVNAYGSGRFAHPNLDFGELKDSQNRGGRHILNALSEIQRYHIIEDRSEEIPKEYFTLEQIWDYIKIGFKSGLLESFIFTGLICFLQAIYPSYKYYFYTLPLRQLKRLFYTLFFCHYGYINAVYDVYLKILQRFAHS